MYLVLEIIRRNWKDFFQMKEMYIQICFSAPEEKPCHLYSAGKPSSSVLYDMILKNDQKK